MQADVVKKATLKYKASKLRGTTGASVQGVSRKNSASHYCTSHGFNHAAEKVHVWCLAKSESLLAAAGIVVCCATAVNLNEAIGP